MAETQRAGVTLKSPTISIVNGVTGWTELLNKLSMGVSQKPLAGAQWTQSDSPPKQATGVSLKSPTVITSCVKEAAKQGMGVSLKGPMLSVEYAGVIEISPWKRRMGVSLKSPTVAIT